MRVSFEIALSLIVSTVALLFDHPDKISLASAFRNLGITTLGNVFAGSVIMGMGY